MCVWGVKVLTWLKWWKYSNLLSVSRKRLRCAGPGLESSSCILKSTPTFRLVTGCSSLKRGNSTPDWKEWLRLWSQKALNLRLRPCSAMKGSEGLRFSLCSRLWEGTCWEMAIYTHRVYTSISLVTTFHGDWNIPEVSKFLRSTNRLTIIGILLPVTSAERNWLD